MTTPLPLARPDWRDSLTLAADLALLGIVVTLACLPVLTAGAALAAASYAVDHACRHRRLPSTMDMLGVFGRALLPGLAAGAVVLTAAAALVLDLRLLSTGVVPGGTVLIGLTGLLGVAFVAVGAAALVRLGATGGRGWRAAVRTATTQLTGRWWLGPALAAVLVVAGALAVAMPVTAPLLAGLGLFALHVVVRSARVPA
jgi:hypothetical protein